MKSVLALDDTFVQLLTDQVIENLKIIKIMTENLQIINNGVMEIGYQLWIIQDVKMTNGLCQAN